MQQLAELIGAGRRRVAIFGLILLGFCATVLVFEEMIEEQDFDELMIARTALLARHNQTEVDRAKQQQQRCEEYTDEKDGKRRPKLEVLSSCVACSDFERNVLRPLHCTPTGFYDTVRCNLKSSDDGSESISFPRPCWRRKTGQRTQFHLFWLANLLVAALSYALVLSRRKKQQQQQFQSRAIS